MRAHRLSVLPAAMTALLALAGCNDGPAEPTYQGWVEADLVFVGPDDPGRLETLSVREGDQVEKGAPLFTVDRNLQQADVEQNKATVINARTNFERAKKLLGTGAGTQKAFDDSQEALREAEARLNSSQTRLERRTVFSPAMGSIQQVYYRPGEVVAAGKPIVALLPPGNVKIRFYVPETALPKISYGQTIKVRCDTCAADITARVTFISGSAEFTPPVIYSLEERSKLVFLIEARTDTPRALRVGQPVSVTEVSKQAEARR
jgi:HlyD family secretion protein